MKEIVMFAGFIPILGECARRLGAYDAAGDRWPEGWRRRRAGRADAGAPYREADATAWERVVPAGIPRAVSLFMAPAALLTAFWTIAVVLALEDVASALGGRRALGFALASLALCAVRASGGWCALAAARVHNTAAFALGTAMSLGLDVTLWATPLPCSDIRADDVRLALVGAMIHAPWALGYAWSQWRRRGVVGAAAPDALFL